MTINTEEDLLQLVMIQSVSFKIKVRAAIDKDEKESNDAAFQAQEAMEAHIDEFNSMEHDIDYDPSDDINLEQS